MSDRTLTAIAAFAKNRVIGADNDMVWNLPEDWARFKKVTTGGVMIMGRKTNEAIGKPLPERTTIVITRNTTYESPGVRVVHSVPEALAALEEYPDQRWWVAGGAEVYELFWPHLTNLDVTELHEAYAGDALFPEIDAAHWRETSRTARPEFDFVEYVRITPDLPR